MIRIMSRNRNFEEEKQDLQRVCESNPDWDFNNGRYDNGEEFVWCERISAADEVVLEENGRLKVDVGEQESLSYEGTPREVETTEDRIEISDKRGVLVANFR